MLSQATYFVSIGNNINSSWSPVASPTISYALLPMTLKADKLSMDTEPVALDNNTIFTLKLGDQTFFPPYSTDNRSTSGFVYSCVAWQIKLSNLLPGLLT